MCTWYKIVSAAFDFERGPASLFDTYHVVGSKNSEMPFSI